MGMGRVYRSLFDADLLDLFNLALGVRLCFPLLVMSCSVANPFLYAAFSTSFRRRIASLFPCTRDVKVGGYKSSSYETTGKAAPTSAAGGSERRREDRSTRETTGL